MYPPFLNNNDEMSIGHELKLDQLDQLSFQFLQVAEPFAVAKEDATEWCREEGEDWDFCFIVIVKRLLSQFPIIAFVWPHDEKRRRSAVKWHPKPDQQN